MTPSERRSPMRPEPALLALRGVAKRFGDTVANQDLELDIAPGEIHAVLGENGAGKSTLMKIIYGVLAPDEGEIFWKGAPIALKDPAAARRLGVGMVFQHFSLFETLTVAENIALASDARLADIRVKIRDSAAQLGLEIEADAIVHALSMGERQRVEILRALLQKPELIIMDEPTSVLPPSAVPSLFATIRLLAERGCAILFISHKLEEIRSLCHRATIMRQGRIVATVDPREESAARLAKLMIGRDIPHPSRGRAQRSAAPALSTRGLSMASNDPFGVDLEDIDLDVHGGEIVGVAGVSGNGQRQLAAALAGERRVAAGDRGDVALDARSVASLDCGARRRLGLAYIPEERLGRGAAPEMSLEENALLTGARHGLVRRGFIRRGPLAGFTDACIAAMDVRCRDRRSEARSLSGGNLQKFIVAREIALRPKVLIAAQPTWGVDVGAAQAILQKLVDLRDEGVAVLMLSDELEDLLDVSDRIHVMFRGRLSPSIPREDASEAAIGAYMAGDFPTARRPLERSK